MGITAMTSYAKFRRPSEYTMEICNALQHLKEKVQDPSLRVGSRNGSIEDLIKRLKGRVSSVDKGISDYWNKFMRNYEEFLDWTNIHTLLHRCNAKAAEFLKKKYFNDDITSKMNEVRKIRRETTGWYSYKNRKTALVTIHANLDEAKRLLESAESEIVDKIKAYLESGAEDPKVSVDKITKDSLGKVNKLLKKACDAIEAVRKKHELELLQQKRADALHAKAKEEHLPKNPPLVETTVAPPAATPSKSATAPPKEEPSWIAGICVFVLLLVLLALAVFCMVRPAASSEAEPEYDVENPAPRPRNSAGLFPIVP